MAAEQTTLSVLVIDDDDNLRNAICLNLNHAKYACEASADPKEALRQVKQQSFDIILCDHQMPGLDGLEFIERCREIDPSSLIILMTAFGNHELAVKALRAGAYDYIAKPFEFDELVLTLKKLEERKVLKQENAELKSAIQKEYNFSNIIAASAQMKDVFETVKRLASFNTTVLIRGESGTGKELLARAIHHNSPRKGKPFVAINCGAIPENLMESELFGHKKGAFTDASRDKRGLFEEADGGTIFLDEIGEMAPHLQVKLLRALQEQKIRMVGAETEIPVDVRVIAATLRDLETDVDEGRFRDDLFYRLNVVSIILPPLRERTEDIPVLVKHFINKHVARLGIPSKEVDPDVMKCFMNYRWRGNVRELENSVERGLVLADGDTIDLQSLPPHIRKAAGEDVASELVDDVPDDDLSIKKHTRALEMKLILKALEKTKGNRTHAAKILEISHRALLYKLKEFGMTEVGKK